MSSPLVPQVSTQVTLVTHLRLAKGGHAEVTRVNGDQIELRMTSSVPPGAPIDAVLDSDPNVVVKIKSHGTKRDITAGEPPVFVLSGRLLSATRELRERLTALIAAKTDEQNV